ncbi:hypothetical protein CYMTET_3602 [Cymbomonas tetramitiformis]|uniref:Uncharacterized protein n=1 Tax=Cymbomonas tetramitiformis TaxID=36881 RepID=A0AAE0LL73_9CHLO|nr:hypothetical protein CYMTET_3602 [Cymbomonas tetramitiformis]
MVMTRLSTSASRRRNLATIFDDASLRHVVSPPTPLTTTAPAAQFAGAAFLATIRPLTRERFDEAVAKHVVKKCFLDKYDRFTGLETHASVLFAKLVPAIKETFIAEEPLFATLFDLDDATVAVRPEANKLLFSTLELVFAPNSPAAGWLETSADTHPFDGKRVLLEVARRLLDSGSPFHGTQTLLGVRILPNVDPQDAIAVFNTALASALRKTTFCDEEVKSLFIDSLDRQYYAPVVNRLLLHDQRAGTDLPTIQQWHTTSAEVAGMSTQ